MNEIVFPAESLSTLRNDLLAHSPNEAAAVILAGSVKLEGRTRLLVREVFLVPSRYCEVQEPYRVIVSAGFIAPLLKRARQEGWSLIVVHTHPFGEGPVKFSSTDDT